MISRSMKISDLLRQYPESLDVLVSTNTAFRKLKNPLLRKMMASRVTIAQAAAIANVSEETLLRKLSKACGNNAEHIAGEKTSETISSFPRHIHIPKPSVLHDAMPERFVLVDVREDIRSHADPFKKIITAAKQLRSNGILHLVNLFEPVPLYDVLARRGLAHWTERDGDDWHVYFYHDASDRETAPTREVPAGTSEIGNGEKIIELDVSGLEPPEPMMKILATLPTLDESSALLVHHHREPKMLYPLLQERGYDWQTQKLGEERFRIVIRMNKEE